MSQLRCSKLCQWHTYEMSHFHRLTVPKKATFCFSDISSRQAHATFSRQWSHRKQKKSAVVVLLILKSFFAECNISKASKHCPFASSPVVTVPPSDIQISAVKVTNSLKVRVIVEEIRLVFNQTYLRDAKASPKGKYFHYFHLFTLSCRYLS